MDKENIKDDIVFEMELVRQIEVTIDYILMLVAKYHKSNCNDKGFLVAINKAIKSSLELRSKKDLIENFIETINGKRVAINVYAHSREECGGKLAEMIVKTRSKSDEENSTT